MRGHKRLCEICENSYPGSPDSGRSPDGVPMRTQRPGVFMTKGRVTVTSQKESVAIGADNVT